MEKTIANSELRERPLSPHLSIYRWHLSMVMSIAHRATGVALVFGTILLGWILIAIAMGQSTYTETISLINTWPGYIILLGWTLSLYYHLFNGIRHLFWDTGYGFELKTAGINGIIVIALTFLFTGTTFYCAI